MENNILNKRLTEVLNFIKYKEKYDFRYDIVKSHLIKILPFRDTDDLHKEMSVFNQKYKKTLLIIVI